MTKGSLDVLRNSVSKVVEGRLKTSYTSEFVENRRFEQIVIIKRSSGCRNVGTLRAGELRCKLVAGFFAVVGKG